MKKHLETDRFVFFADLTESDENSSVKIYDKNNTLICCNIHAYNYFFEVINNIENETIVFMSDELTTTLMSYEDIQ